MKKSLIIVMSEVIFLLEIVYTIEKKIVKIIKLNNKYK